MVHVVAGLTLGFTLIVAIGPQNAFVIRQGIRGERVVLVAGICAASDAVLIPVSVAGVGAVTTAAPWLAIVARWVGAAFLLGYAVQSAQRVVRGTAPSLVRGAITEADATASQVGVLTRPKAAVPVALTCLALTWLNPHFYLDNLFLLAPMALSHGEGRWLFAGGALLASLVWFFGLALLARLLGHWVVAARSWRAVDAGMAVVMLGMAGSLVMP